MRFGIEWTQEDAAELRALVERLAAVDGDRSAVYAATNARLRCLEPDVILRAYRESTSPTAEIENPAGWLRRTLDRRAPTRSEPIDDAADPLPGDVGRQVVEAAEPARGRVRIPPLTASEDVHEMRAHLARGLDRDELRRLLDRHGHTAEGVRLALDELGAGEEKPETGEEPAGEDTGNALDAVRHAVAASKVPGAGGARPSGGNTGSHNPRPGREGVPPPVSGRFETVA